MELTVGGIRSQLKKDPIRKAPFSMVKCNKVLEQMDRSRDIVVLTGTEAHVAINFTCIDLLAKRFKVSQRLDWQVMTQYSGRCVQSNCNLLHFRLDNMTTIVIFKVHVVADAVSSRTQTDRQLAFGRMDKMGAFVTTTETVLMNLVGGTSHPQYKEIQKKITDVPEEPTGLVFSEKDFVDLEDSREYIP